MNECEDTDLEQLVQLSQDRPAWRAIVAALL